MIDKKILEAVQFNNAAAIEKHIQQFVDAIQPLGYHQAMTYMNQFVVTILKHFDFTIGILRDASKHFYSMVGGLSQFETLDEMAEALKQLCLEIGHLIEVGNNQKNREVIDQIQQYIAKHYGQPDLSLDKMADLVGLSSGYMGRIFRLHCGMSFNDYLKMVRLEKSKELLVETDDPIAVISEKIGIYNTSYFPTQFKKSYGISPSQYRTEHSTGKLGKE